MSFDYLNNKFYLLEDGHDPHLDLHDEAFLWETVSIHSPHKIILNHAQKYYNLGNGLTIPFRSKNYLDICVFATTPIHKYHR